MAGTPASNLLAVPFKRYDLEGTANAGRVDQLFNFPGFGRIDTLRFLKPCRVTRSACSRKTDLGVAAQS